MGHTTITMFVKSTNMSDVEKEFKKQKAIDRVENGTNGDWSQVWDVPKRQTTAKTRQEAYNLANTLDSYESLLIYVEEEKGYMIAVDIHI